MLYLVLANILQTKENIANHKINEKLLNNKSKKDILNRLSWNATFISTKQKIEGREKLLRLTVKR